MHLDRRDTTAIARARSERLPQVTASASHLRTLRNQLSALARDDAEDDGSPPPPSAGEPFTPNPGLSLEPRVPLNEQALVCQ